MLPEHSLCGAPGRRGPLQIQSSSPCQTLILAGSAGPQSLTHWEENAGKSPDPLQPCSWSIPQTSLRYLTTTTPVTRTHTTFMAHLLITTLQYCIYKVLLTNISYLISHHVFIVVDSGVGNISLVPQGHDVQFLESKIKKLNWRQHALRTDLCPPCWVLLSGHWFHAHGCPLQLKTEGRAAWLDQRPAHSWSACGSSPSSHMQQPWWCHQWGTSICPLKHIKVSGNRSNLVGYKNGFRFGGQVHLRGLSKGMVGE